MSARERVSCRVTVALESPFLMRGLEGLAFGVDAAQLRNGGGNALIPGNQLRGVLRQAVRDLIAAGAAPAAALDEIDLFGRPPKDARGQPDEQRGHLAFSDLVAQLGPTDAVLPRVALDPETGSARSGHLLIVELPAPIGAVVTFDGDMLLFPPVGQAAAIIAGLNAALALVPAIGAYKTVGFGRVVGAGIEMLGQPEPLRLSGASARNGERWRWSFGFDRPLMVASERLEENVLASTEVIPGNILKGALARRLALAGIETKQAPWLDLLSRLRIGHAWPIVDGKRVGRSPPLSIATDSDGTSVRDELLRDHASLLEGNKVPCFAPDWKDEAAAKVRQRLGDSGARLGEVMRTRTAIEPETGAADEGSLFSFRMIDPKDVRWETTADTVGLGGPELDQLLDVMARGLDGIGKTDASMLEARLEPAGMTETPEPTEPGGDLFAVSLETPALLIDTPALENADTLRAAFADYFAHASCRNLRLERFFAAQHWAGGIVAMRRKPYRPFVLVDAGSCFLLRGDPAPLKDWTRSGLPAPRWAAEQGLDWRTCPYLPENGFGEIAINRARPIWESG